MSAYLVSEKERMSRAARPVVDLSVGRPSELGRAGPQCASLCGSAPQGVWGFERSTHIVP